MLRQSLVLLKKGWTYHPGGRNARRGAKNPAWNPKQSKAQAAKFFYLRFEYPRTRPDTWQPREFQRLGMVEWPKAVGFWNAGDNWEVTPDMAWRLFQRNKDAPWWTERNNENTVIELLPRVEQSPKEYLPKVDAIFAHHVGRFGYDHVIYNAAMQARAFAKDMPGCLKLFDEMNARQLEPNAQTIVNLMLATRLCGLPKEQAFQYFQEGVRLGALTAMVRMDTEFDMWWSQLDRLGSFTSPVGHLGVKEEGAAARPRNMWALRGWDLSERKFETLKERVKQARSTSSPARKHRVGTMLYNTKRAPWAKYQGYKVMDFKGPMVSRQVEMDAARLADQAPPAAAHA